MSGLNGNLPLQKLLLNKGKKGTRTIHEHLQLQYGANEFKRYLFGRFCFGEPHVTLSVSDISTKVASITGANEAQRAGVEMQLDQGAEFAIPYNEKWEMQFRPLIGKSDDGKGNMINYVISLKPQPRAVYEPRRPQPYDLPKPK